MSADHNVHRVVRPYSDDAGIGEVKVSHACTARYADSASKPDVRYWMATLAPAGYVVTGMVHESDALLRIVQQLRADAEQLERLATTLSQKGR